MPIVSVIIPVYNGEKTIKKTIDSVLKQTLTDFELIVIDSGSTDSTFSIISQIQDSRLRVYSYPKANVAVNRNRGFEHCLGKFISFLDADDIWAPDKLEAQYNALVESKAVVAYSFTDAIDENDKFLRPCSHAAWSGDVFSQLLLDDFIGSGSNVMIRAEAFTEVGGFDGSLSNAQDTDLWVRLAAIGDFVAVKKVQVLYRISANSMSSNVLGLEKSNLQVIERAYAHPKASQYQHLKSVSIANLYKYLSHKALSAPPGQHNAQIAARFLVTAVKHDKTLLFKPILYKALLKLAAMSFLSPKGATDLLNKFPRLSDTSTFFGYIKVN